MRSANRLELSDRDELKSRDAEHTSRDGFVHVPAQVFATGNDCRTQVLLAELSSIANTLDLTGCRHVTTLTPIRVKACPRPVAARYRQAGQAVPVGTMVTHRPPDRSVRAALPHQM
jgi:hypothetical protein